MPDGDRIVAVPFAFSRPLDTWARFFAVVPTRSYVRIAAGGFEAVFGPWRVATPWSNVVGVERTGPYRAWKVGGPARVSWSDRGITMAATTDGGVCLRFRDPVRGIDPFGLIRHPAATLGVEDPDGFVHLVQQCLAEAAPSVGSAAPPDHHEGRLGAAARAVASWMRRDVDHEQRGVEVVEFPALDRAGDADDQPVEIGVGPAFHRSYRTLVRDAAMDAAAAMAAVQADPNLLADLDLAPFTKARGTSGEMRVGDRYVIEIAGPWKGAVEVLDVTALSFRLATLEGHMESGVLEMRARDHPSGPGTIEFTIESWARSHDRFLDVVYDKLGLAKALQAEMWSIACDRFARLVRGEHVHPLHVVTERAT